MTRSERQGQRLDHSAIVVQDLDRSLSFWRDGIGLAVLSDDTFEGDWPALFGARTRQLRSVFLGEAGQPGAGKIELVVLDRPERPDPQAAAPARSGFLLLSFYLDVASVLGRLEDLGIPPVAEIEVDGRSGPVRMATVVDPDGVLVELIDRPRPS